MPHVRYRRGMPRLVVLLALLILALPAGASAQTVTRGSTLAATPSTVAEGNDCSAYFALGGPVINPFGATTCTYTQGFVFGNAGTDPRTGFVPANGVINTVTVKVGANPAPLRFVVLRQITNAQLGAVSFQVDADLANRCPPELKTHDRNGHRLDRVDFHPSWHRLLGAGVAAGLHSSPWASPGPGGHVLRAAAFVLHAEIENGTLCPLSMTYGSASAFLQAPALAAGWLPKVFSRDHDASFVPVEQKRGALIGMGMTEKQGGSDVRSNATVAAPVTVLAAAMISAAPPWRAARTAVAEPFKPTALFCCVGCLCWLVQQC